MAGPAMSIKELKTQAVRMQNVLDGVPKDIRAKERENEKKKLARLKTSHPKFPSQILFEQLEFGPNLVQLRFEF